MLNAKALNTCFNQKMLKKNKKENFRKIWS